MALFRRLCHPFTDEDLNLLRVLKLVTSTGRDLMYQVFQYGCPNKDRNMTLKEYLITQKNMREREYKAVFSNTTMRRKILDNPSGELFDVPLLLQVIKASCDQMAHKDSPLWYTIDQNQLEYLLKCLKDERNMLVHDMPAMDESEMQQKIDDLRDLLINILERTCDRFNIDDSTRRRKLKELKGIIESTRKQPLTKEQIQECQKLLRLEHGIRTLKSEGAKDLERIFKKLLNPVSYVDGCDTDVNIDEVFMDMRLEVLDRIITDKTVSHKEILHLLEEPTRLIGSQQRSVGSSQCITHMPKGFIFITGPSGSGKSTLVQMLMNEWAKPSTDILALSDYDLILPVKCCEQHCNSLAELLEYLVPNTCAIIDSDITTYALNLRLLVVLDGMEEINDSSRKLVQELLHLCKNNHHTILCTSRPEGSQDFMKRVPSEYKKIQLKISDVPKNMATKYVVSYHDQLVHMKRSLQSTTALVQYVNSVVHPNFCRNQNNLVLLTYLWAFGVIRSNTTMTELYSEVNKMLTQKIIQRLLQRDVDGNLSHRDLHRRIRKFKYTLFKEALLTLQPNLDYPQPLNEERLRDQCKDENYFHEFASTFLMWQITWTSTGIKEQVCFPHKGILEFYTAQGLLHAVSDKEFYSSLSQVIESNTNDGKLIHPLIRAVFKDIPLDTINFLHVLKHLAGLMSIHNNFVNNILARELMDLFCMMGITCPDQWVAVMEETRFPQQTVQYIVESYFCQEEDITITNDNIASYTALLPHMNPKHVLIVIEQDPDDLPHLDQLLKVISVKDCYVDLLSWHHYRHPQQNKTTDELLRILLHSASRCSVQTVRGQLSGNPLVELDGVRLKSVHLSMREDQQASALTAGILQHPHSLKEVRVMPGVTASNLTPLPPDGSTTRLDLTHLEANQVVWAGQVACILASQNRLHTVSLPEWSSGAAVGLLLEEELNNLGVIVDNFFPCSYLKKVREEVTLDLPDINCAQFTSVMKFTNPRCLTLDIHGAPDDLADLGLVIDSFSQKKCRVDLRLQQHIRDPQANEDTADSVPLCSDQGFQNGPVRPSDAKAQSPLSTHPGTSLRETLKLRAKNEFSKYHKIERGLQIRMLDMVTELQHKEEKVQLLTLGQKTNVTTKITLIVGATGIGKTTLINAMVNYVFGIDFTDDFRLTIPASLEMRPRQESQSQTDFITTYMFYYLPGMPFEYNYVLIDTPGFGDTRGILWDREMMNQLRIFLENGYGVDQVDAVAFVTPASAARLTQTQLYIYDGISSMFGKDIKNNIYIMATFADAHSPPVLEPLKRAGISYVGVFNFNNSALYACNTKDEENSDSDSDELDDLFMSKVFWTICYRSMTQFFIMLGKTFPASLTLTKEVLKERHRLHISVMGLQKQIHVGLSKLSNLYQERDLLAHLAAEIKNASCTDEVEVPEVTKIDLKANEFVTNCIKCSMTCHFPCRSSENDDKINCSAMTDEHCRICPGKCYWKLHENMSFRYEHNWKKEQRTVHELLHRYQYIQKRKVDKEAAIKAIEDDIMQYSHSLIVKIKEVQSCVERLEEIALKPNPVSTKKYIDLMIETEKMNKQYNFQKRIQMLHKLKEEAAVIQGVRGNYSQKSGEALLRHFRSIMID